MARCRHNKKPIDGLLDQGPFVIDLTPEATKTIILGTSILGGSIALAGILSLFGRSKSNK